jgi:ribonuclease-3
MTLPDIEKFLGVTFNDQTLLEQAFYHRSYLNEAKQIKQSNERLEFLGDAVLSFLTSQFLYKMYPQYPEGTLTNIRSSLVKTTTLGAISKELSFGDLLKLSKGEAESGGRNNPSLLADCFEAFLGALFLDQGIDVAGDFLKKVLFPKTDDIVKTKSYIDFKSYLQEITQEMNKISPTYTVIHTQGPDHDRTFTIEVSLLGKTLGSGVGKSKQEGEQAAAKNSLEQMGKL